MSTAAQAPQRLSIRGETILRIHVFVMLAIGSVSFVEPSPYEFMFFLLGPLVLFGFFVLTRVTMLLVLFALAFLVPEIVSLLPYISDRPSISLDGYGSTPLIYTLESVYLFGSAIMFAIIFTRHTQPRLKVALIAYTVSCVFAAGIAIGVYLKFFIVNENTVDPTRITGPFKDPNVLGSYTVLGAVYLIQVLLMTSRLWLRLLCLPTLGLVLFGGLFLPLSRGAWAAMAFATIYFAIVTFWTSDRKMRRKLIFGAALLGMLGTVVGGLVVMDDTLSETFTKRAKIEQDYDNGTTGRFGNQKRSIPMLMERPLGFGPHRFTMYFDLDPHNSYIGAYASAGWVGGTAFLMLVLVTSFLAVRLSVMPTPFLREAQVIAPVLLSGFLQAIQIDIDHWRFIHLMIGAVWGMEAARQLAMAKSRRKVSAAAPMPIGATAAAIPSA